MKFEFVAKRRGVWPAAVICGALGVSHSGFYAWLNRPRSQCSLTHESIGKQVKQSFLDSDRTYGARRVWRDVLASGVDCALHLIEKLMQQQALPARPRRRGLPKDDSQRGEAASNVLDRQFKAEAPNQKWVADFMRAPPGRIAAQEAAPKGRRHGPWRSCEVVRGWALA